MNNILQISPINEEDYEAIKTLFIDCVHSLNQTDYSQEQIDCWAPKSLTAYDMKEKLQDSSVFKAIINNEIVGFISLYPSGFIGYLYVSKNHILKGIGKSLVDFVENQAKQIQLPTLNLEASITAYPFFKKIGFKEEYAQLKLFNHRYFKNYKMIKHLN